MSSDQNHSSDRMSALRARLDKFESVDEFIAGYSQYFFRGGILLPTRHAKPEGTQISMQIEISGGETVLRAEGEVKQVRRNDLGRPVGMVIRFSRLDARSREIVERVLQHKKTIAETGSMQAVVERATERRAQSGDVPALGDRDLNAIAAAIDDTFDSIFAGAIEPAVTVDTPVVPDEHGGSPARGEAEDLHDPPTGRLEVHQTNDRGPAVFDDDEAASLRAELARDDDDDDALEALKEIAASLEDDVDASEPATQQVPRAVAPGAAPVPARTVFGMPAFEADDAGPAPPVEEPAPSDDGELTDQHDVVDHLEATGEPASDETDGDPDDIADAAAEFLSRISEDSGPEPSLGADEDEQGDGDGDELASGRTASSVYRGVAGDEGDDEGAAPPPVDGDGVEDDLKAAITGAYDAIDEAPHSEPVLSSSDQPIAPAPKGLLGRFIAWLKRLFGG